MAVGTIVWVVRPDKQVIEVFESGKAVKTYRQGASVSGGDLLPDFELNLDDVFKV